MLKIFIILSIILSFFIFGCTTQRIQDRETGLEKIKNFDDREINTQKGDFQCSGKPNDEPCSYGMWIDEYGKVCGGSSCVGLGIGKCIDGVCTQTQS